MRVSKTDAATLGGRIVYVYDENAHLIGEYDGTGALIEETVWLGDLPVAVLRASGTLYVASDQLGSPWALIGGGAGASQVSWLWDTAHPALTATPSFPRRERTLDQGHERAPHLYDHHRHSLCEWRAPYRPCL